ncbi:MAG: thioredoxin domain-containing protein, partial [Pseudomonadota bacterium]|nr:thioredoxin domain-containing protein [Pseudomonadota bacterium]
SYDNATPSGNAISALALQRVAYLTGDLRYSAVAERVLKLFYPQADQRQGGFSSLMGALAEYLEPPETVILRGAVDTLPPWKQALARLYSPHRLVLAIPADTQKLTVVLDKPVKDLVNAWVCRGVSCLSPINDLQQLLEACQSRRIN